MKPINTKTFIDVCNNSLTMADAASTLGLHFNTFKRHAVKLGCYRPNQGACGKSKPSVNQIPIDQILDGQHSSYQSNKLRVRLIAEGIKKHQCEKCFLTCWLDAPIPLELHHIDGDRTNHKLNNLQLLCPNCHSQTETFRGKNRKAT